MDPLPRRAHLTPPHLASFCAKHLDQGVQPVLSAAGCFRAQLLGHSARTCGVQPGPASRTAETSPRNRTESGASIGSVRRCSPPVNGASDGDWSPVGCTVTWKKEVYIGRTAPGPFMPPYFSPSRAGMAQTRKMAWPGRGPSCRDDNWTSSDADGSTQVDEEVGNPSQHSFCEAHLYQDPS